MCSFHLVTALTVHLQPAASCISLPWPCLLQTLEMILLPAAGVARHLLQHSRGSEKVAGCGWRSRPAVRRAQGVLHEALCAAPGLQQRDSLFDPLVPCIGA